MIRSRLRLWFYFIVVFAGFELETGFFQSDLFVHMPRLLILLLQSERGEEDMPDLMEAFRGQLRALPGEFGGKCACRGVVSNKCLRKRYQARNRAMADLDVTTPLYASHWAVFITP